MKIILLLIVSAILFNGSSTDEEVTVEDDNSIYSGPETPTRRKRLFWKDLRSPALENFMRVIRSPYNAQSPMNVDFFRPFRDSYPLPKGKLFLLIKIVLCYIFRAVRLFS